MTTRLLQIVCVAAVLLTLTALPARADRGTEPAAVNIAPFDITQPAVPADAIAWRAGIPGVFVVQNTLARFRMVRPGKHSAQRHTILSGLKNGDPVILNPQGLYDGQAVKVQP